MAISIRRKQVARSSLFSGVSTASANGTADSGFAGLDAMVCQLIVTVVTGTTPSMVVKVQDSTDNTNWNDLATFTAATAATAEVKRVSGPFAEFVRSISTITGTTPSFTYTLTSDVEGGRVSKP